MGIIILGKNTRVIKRIFRIRLIPDLCKDCENKVQGNKPVNEKSSYAVFSESTLIKLPKIIVKITVVINGCRMTQTTPKMVWRYLNWTSRLANMKKRSRYSQISLKSIPNQPVLGWIIVNFFLDFWDNIVFWMVGYSFNIELIWEFIKYFKL